MLTCLLSAIMQSRGHDRLSLWLAPQWSRQNVKGKILMFPNKIWGSQVETRQWALEIKPKGYQYGVSPPKQEIEAAP